MTKAQSAIVGGFVLVPAAAAQSACPSNNDGTDYIVTLTDPEGVDAVYHANGLNADCGGTGTVLAWTTFQPILATYACLTAQQTATGDTLAHAVALPSSATCDDGVFATQAADLWFKLDVPTAGTHVARVIDCGSIATSLTVYDAAGTAPLAASTSGDAGTCPQVTYAFPAGSYSLKLSEGGGCCQFYFGFE